MSFNTIQEYVAYELCKNFLNFPDFLIIKEKLHNEKLSFLPGLRRNLYVSCQAIPFYT